MENSKNFTKTVNCGTFYFSAEGEPGYTAIAPTIQEAIEIANSLEIIYTKVSKGVDSNYILNNKL